MKIIIYLALIGPLASKNAQASVTVVWSGTDAAASAAWLSGIEAWPSDHEPDSFFVFSTDYAPTGSLPFTAILSVGSSMLGGEFAELNIFGVGRSPNELSLHGPPGIESIFRISWQDFVVEREGRSSTYSYSGRLNFDQGFTQDVRDAAATDALGIRAFFTVDSGESMVTYLMQPTAIPEPGPFSLALLAAGSTLFRRNRRGEQVETQQPSPAALSSESSVI
jgi:hypothetical protein